MSDGHTLDLAAFEPCSAANGPGDRAVIWVQGCHRRCPGCFNPDFQPFTGGEQGAIADLADEILAIDGIEGITLSGGEPFEQAVPLTRLCSLLRPSGLTVLTFTGYTLTVLCHKPARHDWRGLLAMTDLLVAGPYLQHMPCSDALRGSSNQRLHFLTDRIPPPTVRPARQIEVHLSGDTVRISGFPDSDVFGMPRDEGEDRE